MMTIKKRNVQVIYDLDHGTENEGWYSRHDEYDESGELLNGACDNILDAETAEEAVEETRLQLDLDDGVEVEVIDRRDNTGLYTYSPAD